MTTTTTPQDAFREAAKMAKGYFAGPRTDTEGFAQSFGWEVWNTGGGNMLAIKMLDSRHVLGVNDEVTCLYETGEDRDDAAGLIAITEDPWLITENLDEARPVAGVDTPAEDDIIHPCFGDRCVCGGWVVSIHPRHIGGGGTFIDGKCMKWEPTPEWVEAEAKRIAYGRSCRSGCGRPVGPLQSQAEAEAEMDRVHALRHFTGEEC
jgi:hypothetical protein